MGLSMRVLFAALLIVMEAQFSVVAFGQVTGSISGTVTDPTGAVVPGARVTVKNVDTGVAFTTVTNSSGNYLAGALNPGTYDVSAELKGFQTYARTGIPLHVNEAIAVDIQLQVGAMTTSVSVKASPVSVHTESGGELSGTIIGKQVQEIPINGPHFLQLATLVPGATSLLPNFNAPIPVTSSSAVQFNGVRDMHTMYSLDGADNREVCQSCLVVLPTKEAIQEFKVTTGVAEPGTDQIGGGGVSVGIKQGGSRYHGEVYEFFRNNKLDAANILLNNGGAKKGELRWNNWGWQLGGFVPGTYPRHHLYFFFSEEWRRLVQGTTIVAPAVSSAERQGDFSGQLTGTKDAQGNDTGAIFVPQPLNSAQAQQFSQLGLTAGNPFPNNQIPAQLIDPNARLLSSPSLIPLPTSGKFFRGEPSVPTTDREEIIRMDYNVNDRWRLMWHFVNEAPRFQSPTSLWTNSTYPTIGTALQNPSKNATLRIATTISPSVLQTVQFGWSENKILRQLTGNFARPEGLGKVGEIFPGIANVENRVPGLDFFGPTLGTAIDPGFDPFRNTFEDYNIRYQLTGIFGKHQITVGWYGDYNRKNMQIFGNTEGVFTFNGSFTKAPYQNGSPGNEFGDFLLGRAFSYSQLAVQDIGHWDQQLYRVWIGDTWKITPRVTVNLGLRIQWLPHTYERFNRQSNFLPNRFDPSLAQTPDPASGQLNPNGPGFAAPPFPPTSSLGLALPGVRVYSNGIGLAGRDGVPRGLVANQGALPGPSVGVAVALDDSRKTILRVGGTISHTRVAAADVLIGAPNPPFTLNATFFNTTLTNTGGSGAFGNSFPSFPSDVYAFEFTNPMPTTAEASFTLERQVFSNAVFRVGYVGSYSYHLRIPTNLNQPLDNNPLRGKVDANQIRPFPGFGNILFGVNSSNSQYNSLQADLTIRNWHGLSLETAYTWSKVTDLISGDFGAPGNPAGSPTAGPQDSFNQAADKGVSDFDRTHVLVINHVWSIPFFTHDPNRWKRNVLGGWQFSGISTFQSGTPISVFTPGDPAGIGVSGKSRADLVPGQDPNGGPKRGAQVFNANAFAATPSVDLAKGLSGFGNSGRNIVRLPFGSNFDMAFSKEFSGIPLPLSPEGGALEIRTDVFNIFNHPVFTGAFNVFGQTGFGEASSARDPRIIQFSMRFTF